VVIGNSCGFVLFKMHRLLGLRKKKAAAAEEQRAKADQNMDKLFAQYQQTRSESSSPAPQQEAVSPTPPPPPQAQLQQKSQQEQRLQANHWQDPCENKENATSKTAAALVKPRDDAVEPKANEDLNENAKEEDFFIHEVTPADTLGGLELRYGVSSSLIRRLNGMTSDRLNAFMQLKIPKKNHRQPTNLAPTMIVDKRTEKMQILRVFRINFPDIGEHEVEYYLSMAKGSVREGLELCRRDIEWERKNKRLQRFHSAKKHQAQMKDQQEQLSLVSPDASTPATSPSAAWFASWGQNQSENTDQNQKSFEEKPEASWDSVDQILRSNDPDGPNVSLLDRDYLMSSPGAPSAHR